jgi:hypothetical protein
VHRSPGGRARVAAVVAGSIAAIVPIVPIAVPTAAVGAPLAEECTGIAQDEMTAAAQAHRCGRDVEITEARSEWNTLYAQADGMLRLDSSTAAIRARRGEAWVGIDNTVVHRDGSLEVASAVNPMTFSDGTPGVPLATIERNDHTLSLDVPFDLPAPQVDLDKLTYAQVLPGVDLIVTVNSDATGFAEVLRVASPEAAADPRLTELSFPIVTSDGLVVDEAEGGFVAKDASGHEVFTSPTPAMWDSAESVITAPLTGERAALSAFGEALQLATEDAAGTADVDRTEAPSGTEQIELLPASITGDAVTFRPDESMLLDPSTVWPVYIDPPVSGSLNDWTAIRDAYGPAYRFNPDQGVGKCDVGTSSTCSTTFRSRLKYRFAGLQAIGDAEVADIHTATFTVMGTHSYDCTPRPVNVYRTDDFNSSSTWPGGNWQFQSQQVVAHKSGCAASPVRRIEFAVVEAAQALASSNGSVLALGIMAADESSMAGWKRYGYDATLSIMFNRPPNLPTDVTLTNPAAACATGSARPYVRVTNPTISGVFSDPNNQAVQADVDVFSITPPTWRTSLGVGGVLAAGESLKSPDGRTALVLQTDGNLVVYGPNSSVLWNAGTQGRGGTYLVLQGDGNLVLYTAANGVVWHNGAYGLGGTHLEMQDDGNLVLYTPTNGVVWHTNSNTVAPWWHGRSQPQISGATHAVTVAGLKNGGIYRIVIRGMDTDGWVGPSVTCEVAVDLTAPPAPTAAAVGPGPLYTFGTLTGGPTQAGFFTLGPGGASDIVKYVYSFNSTALDREKSGSTVTVDFTPTAAGTYTLYYASVDRAGWSSQMQSYRFSVAADTMDWLFDESSGNQALPGPGSTAGGPSLALSGSVTRAAGPWAEFNIDAADGAVFFDSPADTVLADRPVIETNKDFSVVAVVNATSADAVQSFVSQDGSATSAFDLGTSPCVGQGGLCWSFSMRATDSASSARTTAVSSVPVEPGKWTVVAGRHSASADTLEVEVCTIGDEFGIDLQLREPTVIVPFAQAWAANGRFRVGPGPWSAWQGSISEVHATRGAISDGDLLRICNRSAE